MTRFVLILMLLMATPALADEHWHGGGGWGWHGGGGWGWHEGWHPSYNGGNDFLGGMVGGVLGSWLFPPPRPVIIEPQPVIVAPQVPEMVPGSAQWYAYCANKYRSFNAQTGTYMGFDGQAHACQ